MYILVNDTYKTIGGHLREIGCHVWWVVNRVSERRMDMVMMMMLLILMFYHCSTISSIKILYYYCY